MNNNNFTVFLYFITYLLVLYLHKEKADSGQIAEPAYVSLLPVLIN